ncbi:MAG TPA: aminodeoxychorismate/anthranilate synthase component II [Thermoanaerobaculia bacterium]|nr:aminodeoxychorismate/anthranilate synthase component II [Thermoanaerobaculia bacterium]
MIVLIDNYDSFTFNLAQLLEVVGGDEVEVVRNDAYEPEALLASRPRAIVVSPGPGIPARAGRIVETIRADRSVPLLGVCLGHQAIAEAFGGRVVRAKEPVHGKVDAIEHSGRRLFEGCERPLRIARYHSLVADPASLPAELEVDATAGDGSIMALAHRERPIHGLQFHPESYGTPEGHRMIANFLSIGGPK